MGFKKLALAAAVAAAPMSALALEPMADEAMSAVTGQDGISMTINGNISTDVWIEDTDGFTGVAGAGFMTIAGLNVSLADTKITIDAGSDDGAGAAHTGATSGVLRVGISIPTPITLNNLNIGVQGSTATANAAADHGRVGLIGDSTTVLSVGTVTLAASELQMLLGPDSSNASLSTGGNLLALSGTVNVGLTNVELYGGTSVDGWIGASSINVNNVVLDGTTANLNATGLVVSLGASMTDVEVDISRLTLGGTGDWDNDTATPDTAPPALGNVYLDGLSLAGTTVTISGH